MYNYPEQVLANAGVTSIEHADFDGVERLALVTGGEICSTLTTRSSVLGTCDAVEEIMIGEDKLIKFSASPRARRARSSSAAPRATSSARRSVPCTTPCASSRARSATAAW